jgi:hypothetical protein
MRERESGRKKHRCSIEKERREEVEEKAGVCFFGFLGRNW